jgi:hypothetical protein
MNDNELELRCHCLWGYVVVGIPAIVVCLSPTINYYIPLGIVCGVFIINLFSYVNGGK